MTDASRHPAKLAARAAARYVSETGPHAILPTCSAAEGVSDAFSDFVLLA